LLSGGKEEKKRKLVLIKNSKVMKYGTEKIQGLLDYGFSWVMRIKKVKSEDSAGGTRVTLPEMIGSLGLVMQVPDIIGDAKEAKLEFLDLDDAEVMAMKEHFAEKFDIPNDKLEATLEDVWEILLRTGKIIKRHSS